MPTIKFRDFQREVCGHIWRSVDRGAKNIGILYSHGTPVGIFVMKCPECRAPYWNGSPKEELI